MPRTEITPPEKVTFLSILDHDGRLDEALEPAVDGDTLVRLYRCMLLGRRFDERLLSLQRQGRIGTFPPIKGQEAAQVGSVAHLRDSDWLVPSFRETAAEIWRGRSLENIIISNNGFNEAGAMAADSRNFPISVPVGSQLPHAVGLAWAAKYRRTDEVVMAFFGDGATSEGDFHEALNCAAVFQCPVVFVCQNNQWAISVPLSRQTRSRTIAQKALAYGMPGIQVDGNDILAVYAAAGEAVERARSGLGPALIECVTYRLGVHTTADDPKRYRSEEEVEAWSRRDPLTRFETYLVNKGVLRREALEDLQRDIMEQIQTAVDNAEAQMQGLGDPLALFDHLYADRPPYLQAQKVQFSMDLEGEHGEAPHG